MASRRPLVAALVLALAPAIAALGPCVDEDALRVAQERRDELLRTTVPRAELFRELERKGGALDEARKLAASAAPGAAQAEAVSAEIASAEAQLAALNTERAAREAVLAQAREDLAAARREREARERTLRGFESRRRAATP